MIRFLDILFSSIALLVLSPLLIPVCCILKLTGEGEILYLQPRVGREGEVFMLMKFATMLKSSPDMEGGDVTRAQDPRVLPVGRVLRKTKINELPQLFNILSGDMSIIGPRPLTPRTFDFYSDSVKRSLVKVKPGLSGVGSVIFRGEENLFIGENDHISFYGEYIAPYKGALEVWYVQNKSVKLYLLLTLLTIFVVLFPRSNLAWQLLKGLPEPVENLKAPLNYPAEV